jgi:hypothetical protein
MLEMQALRFVTRLLYLTPLMFAGCGEAEPSLSQTPTAAGLTFADGALAPLDVGSPTAQDSADDDVSAADAATDDTPPDPGDDGGATVGDADAPPDVVEGTDSLDPDDAGVGPDLPLAACQSDGECPAAGACGRGVCDGGRCIVAAVADGAGCDDGDACTSGDACLAGECRGVIPRVCDDGDACTIDRCEPAAGCVTDRVTCSDADACTVNSCDPAQGCVVAPVTCPADNDPCTLEACGSTGACESTPVPGCGSTDPCAGRPGGTICDDGDGATTGDMCLGGTCRGYALQRINGRGITERSGYAYDGLIVTEVDHGPAGWAAVFWSAGQVFGGTALAWSLGDLSTAGQASYFVATLRQQSQPWPREYTGLSDGFVIRGGDELLLFDAENRAWGWSRPWNDAVDAVAFDTLSALTALQDVDASGRGGTQRLWLGAVNAGDGRAIHCTRDPGRTPRCQLQSLQSSRGDPADVYPTALSALPRCTASGCSGAWLAMTADHEAGESGDARWTQETYVNPLGDSGSWSTGWSTSEPSAIETASLATWGTVTAPRLLAVGSDGLLVYGVGSQSGVVWSRIAGIPGQTERDFTGVTVTSDTVLVSATRVSGGEVVLELWTLSKSDLGTVAASWRIHELARASALDLAGLYDVDARANGEVLAVGAIGRQDNSGWLDGLVLRRTGN